MEKHDTLMAYLQQGLEPRYPSDKPMRMRTVSHLKYAASDIKTIGHWDNFNIESIQDHFHDALAAIIPDGTRHDPWPPSDIQRMPDLKAYSSSTLAPALMHPLRLGSSHSTSVHTTLVAHHGLFASVLEGCAADIAFFEPNDRQAPNRVVGSTVGSEYWRLEMRNFTGQPGYFERYFREPLSRVNFIMKQHHTRYGFILTDREFVAIRRLDRHGNIELSDSVSWSATGTPEKPCLTLLLGLWYLGMLAGQEDWALD